MDRIAIALDNVSVLRRERTILADVKLNIPKGACCAIIGPNGAGKSALIAVICGYLWPSQGTVTVNEQAYGTVSLDLVRRHIGLVEPSRSPGFGTHMTVRDVVATGLWGTVMLPLHQKPSSDQWDRVDQEIRSMGLTSLSLQPFHLLSSGEQMKARLARAMVTDADILLLDEPTAGLDMGARAACVKVLEQLHEDEYGPTMVIVSHHLDELPKNMDLAVLVKQGEIFAQGPPDEVLTGPKLSAVFDHPMEVVRQHGRFAACVI
jgi:iron complex transport system ATP-binding protein